jgi:hypothetical protein
MADEEYYKEHNGLWGESLSNMKDRLVYQRKSNMTCVYCSGMADTREHCPPKSFLKEPYPDNLTLIPACRKCNNSFSKAERKFKLLMDNLENNINDERTTEDIQHLVTKHILPDYARMVLYKVAIGHSAYMLSTGFGESHPIENVDILFAIKNQCSQKEWENFQDLTLIDTIPELGSRASDRCLLVKSVGDDSFRMVVFDWINVQDGIYKYLPYHDEKNISVKMVIRDLLYVKVSL